MHKKEEIDLLPQRDRTSSDGREGAIVPGPLPSSSNDGPTSGCTAGPLAEDASAKTIAEENGRAGLPRVLIPPIDKEGRCKPGPAFTQRERSCPRTRSRSRSGSSSRSSSVASVASLKNNAATVVERNRKAQRELEKEVRRCMENAAVARAKSYEDMGEIPDEDVDVELVFDDEEHCEEKDSGSDVEYVDAQETSKSVGKRKRKQQRHRSLPDPKRGRTPRTTGEFIGLAEAKRALNLQKKEEERLEREKKLRLLSGDDLLDHLGVDMEGEIEEAKYGPTADLANRAREGMEEILRVAKISSNIKGDLRKVIRSAAITATAVVEILRTRADCPTDSDVPRQIRALKEEVKQMKAEAARANEEAKRLREELAVMRDEGETRSRRRRVYYAEDSPPSSPGRGQRKGGTVRAAGSAVAALPPFVAAEDTHMEVEAAVGEETKSPPSPKYSDERRKREILPPPEEWPAAIRPALQGKVKIVR